MPLLDKNDHVVLVFNLHVVVNNEDGSAQGRSNIWKVNVQKNTHSESSVDWTIESDYPIVNGLGCVQIFVYRNHYIAYPLDYAKGFEKLLMVV